MVCAVCNTNATTCTRLDCPGRNSPFLWPISGTNAPLQSSPFDLSSEPEDQTWYSDEVMNLLATQAARDAQHQGTVVDVVPAVLGTNNTLGVNFLETFLTHHLLDRTQARPIFVPVNLGERHWIGLHLVFRQGTVDVYYFDSTQPRYLHRDVQKAVASALRLTGHSSFEFYYEFETPVQHDGFNCGPWVIEWMRYRLGLTDWTHSLPNMNAARQQHRAVQGVPAALARDAESGSWWKVPDWQTASVATLERLLKQDILQRFVLPGRQADGTLIGSAKDLIGKGELRLGTLYRRFLASADAKQLAEGLFAVRIRQIDRRYKELKAQFLGDTTSKAHKAPKSWQEKVQGIGKASNKPYGMLDLANVNTPQDGSLVFADVNDDVAVVDLSSSKLVDWLSLSVILTMIRKRFVARWQQRKGNHRHVTVVVLPGEGPPSFWALNTKDEHGNGTTRILLPLRAEPPAGKRTYSRIRLLDLTYEQLGELIAKHEEDETELQKSLATLLCTLGGGDARTLGRVLLALMSPFASEQAECREALAKFGVPVPRMHCVLFRGAMLKDYQYKSQAKYKIPVFDEGWDIKRAPKTGPGAKILNTSIPALDLAYYFLGIMVAEARHARGVYVSTVDLLELVAAGLIQPADLFSSLDGNIEHGWLLPGANFLGGTMPPELKRLAMPLVGSVGRSVTSVEHVPDPIRARVGEILERYGDDETTIDDPSHPVYQVLMKCLFITLLRFLAKCSSDAGPNVSELQGSLRARHPWPVGYEPTKFFFWKPLLHDNGPQASDLLSLLFGDEKHPYVIKSDLEYAEELLEQSRGVLYGSELQRFSSLFRVKLRRWTLTDKGWFFTQVVPACLDEIKSPLGDRVLAMIEYVADVSLGIHGWRIIAPPHQTAEQYLARLRYRYSTEFMISAFEELFEQLAPPEKDSHSRKRKQGKQHKFDDEEYFPSDEEETDDEWLSRRRRKKSR